MKKATCGFSALIFETQKPQAAFSHFLNNADVAPAETRNVQIEDFEV